MVTLKNHKDLYHKALISVLRKFKPRKVLVINIGSDELLKRVNKKLNKRYRLNYRQLAHIFKYQKRYKVFRRYEPTSKYLFIKNVSKKKEKGGV